MAAIVLFLPSYTAVNPSNTFHPSPSYDCLFLPTTIRMVLDIVKLRLLLLVIQAPLQPYKN